MECGDVLQHKRSFLVAFSGLICALSLVVLFLTGIVPFATYSLPCIAGFLLVTTMVECGDSWAWLSYVAISFLAIILTPDREAALMYVIFFGYYPMLKKYLERIPSRLLEWTSKILLFIAAVTAGYFGAVYLLGMNYLLKEANEFGRYSLLAMLGLGTIVFLLYDIALTRVISVYILYLRKKIFRRFH